MAPLLSPIPQIRQRFLAAVPQLPFGITWSSVGFAVRNTAGSLIALYIAILMNLDDPKWAAMTVWIVAQGSRGMSLSKGKYRFVGTLIGAIVAVILTSAFSQTREIFLPALALWLAFCTALSTGLRNFRSYGAVLAGYTAAVVAMDSIANPADVFDIAVARVTYIGLGIVVEAAMSMIFTSSDPLDDIRTRLGGFLQQSASTCAQALRGDASNDALRKLFVSALSVDTAAEYAAATSAHLRRRLGHLRAAMIASLQQLSAARALRAQRAGHAEAEDAYVDEAAALLDTIAANPDRGLAAVSALGSRVEAALAQEAADARGVLSERLLSLHRLHDLLTGLQRALAREQLLCQPNAPRSRVRFSFHIDHTAALLNAVRTFVAVMAASAVWIFTAWPAGSGFVTIVGVVAALFAARPNPLVGSVGFLKGTICAVVAAAVFDFAIMPAISGFVPLAVMLAVFMIGAGLAMRVPRLAAPGAAFAIFFIDLVSPDNLARIDAASFFNGSLALVAGIGIGTLIFALVLPVNVAAVRRRLHRAVRSDLAAIGRNPRLWSDEVWVSRTADRIERQLIAGAGVSATQAESDLRGVLAVLGIGSAAIELHRLSLRHRAVRKPVAAVMRTQAGLDPDRLARVAQLASARLARCAADAAATDAAQILRAAVLLRDIADAAIAQGDFMREGQTRRRVGNDRAPRNTGAALSAAIRAAVPHPRRLTANHARARTAAATFSLPAPLPATRNGASPGGDRPARTKPAAGENQPERLSETPSPEASLALGAELSPQAGRG